MQTRYLWSILIWAILLGGCKAPAMPTETLPPAETPLPAIPVSPAATPPVLDAEVLQTWDFRAKGKALGWAPTHDLGQFSVDLQGLHTFSSGGDPFMIGPRTKIDAQEAHYVEIRMRSSAGNDAQLFWITDTSRDYDEAKSQHLPVKADGQWHTYYVPLSKNPAWTGTVVQLRLDPTTQRGSDLVIGHIAILGPRPGMLEARTFGASSAVVQARETFEIGAQLVNAGDQALGPADLGLVLPGGLSLLDGEVDVRLTDLAPHAEWDLAWRVSGPAGVYELGLMAGDLALGSAFAVVADMEQGIPVEQIETDHLQLAFFRQPYGQGVATLSLRKGDGWRPLGRLRSLGTLTYCSTLRAVGGCAEGGAHQVMLYASGVERIADGLRLSYVFTDTNGVEWSGDSTFQRATNGHLVDVRATLRAGADVHVMSWTPLAFYAGDGSYGAAKENAIFPGVEYLLDEERSSGADFFNPPAHMRYVPHPNKVTVPLMSVTHDGASVGLMWDPLQEWEAAPPGTRAVGGSGAHDRPGALYAVPNTWEGQNNQLLALFLPSPLDFGEENRVHSPQPYLLQAGHTLQLSAQLFAIAAPDTVAATDALAPLALWLQIRGLPDVPPLPRSYEAGIRLGLDATTGPTWNQEAQGWHYALRDPWGPGSSPANELHLWLAALRGDLSAEESTLWRTRVRELSERTDYAGGQPNPLLHLPALQMHLAEDDRLLQTAALAWPKLDTQNEQGFWPYAPQQRSGRPLGEAGDTSSGRIAANALYLLRFARITGDPDLRQAGLRALDTMQMYHARRPEGAQIWELPLHCPDLLAAAWAEQCFLEAYWLTGEARYAQQAQWWALSGLPFVYLWSAPDRPVMVYTTVPAFAATHYVYPWLGRPVMWTGLDYAFGLWRLDEALDEAGVEALVDWRKVAEGITRAAMQMQPDAGHKSAEYTGMYPDAWDVVTGGEAYSWWLHPFYILHNLYLMEEAGAEVQTVLLRDPAGDVHVNAVADIVRAERRGERLEVELAYYAGETSVLMFNRLRQPPSQVLVDGQPLPAIQSLTDGPSGWLYRQDTLLVKIPFDTGHAQIIVRAR